MAGPLITLRRATFADIPLLETWAKDPDVIRATGDEPQELAFGGLNWKAELAASSDVSFYLIGEVDGRPIGAMQIIDPHAEPTHYWGDVEPNLRAVDIWIGSPQDRGRGYGKELMRLAHALCFSDPTVKAIIIDPLASNRRAIAFYQRLGYRSLGRKDIHGDDTEMMRFDRP